MTGDRHMPKRRHPPSVFRSEEMVLCQFFLQDEVAYACLECLGRLEAVQFRDMNGDLSPKDRAYMADMNVILACQSILNHLESEIKKNNLKIPDGDDDIPTPTPGDLLDVRETLEKFDSEVKELEKYIEHLKERYNETVELKTLLELGKKYAVKGGDEIPKEKQKALDPDEPNPDEHNPDEHNPDEMEAGTRTSPDMKTMKINVVGGVVRREKFPSFEQTLWRASRGKIVSKFDHIDHEFEEKGTEGRVLKTAFIEFFQGDKLGELVAKVNEGYRAKIYPLPEDEKKFDKAIQKSDEQRKDLKTIIKKTEKHFKELLDTCAQNLEDWYSQLLRMKGVYGVLNNFTVKPHIGEGWVALSELPDVREELRKTAKNAGGVTDPVVTVIECDDEPPTYFKNDKYTQGFQNLIDAYGVATYKEINPMPFTVITFPFLFAMMFGDLGHGILMFAFGINMIAREKKMLKVKSKNEIRNILFAGRYIIAAMGIFSIYSGFIYNECFSVSMNIFGSCWKISQDFDTFKGMKFVGIDPATDYYNIPYAFGIDPIWESADNKIIFLNSFKMKISIIFGVAQMLGGLALSVWNDWYFGEYADIICMFVPQVIWMLGLFGWLCMLMFIKWIEFGVNRDYTKGPTCAPSVLITFIDMILHKSSPDVPGCLPDMFPNQDLVQQILFICAIVCIPWILLAKPFVLFWCPGKERREKERLKKLKKKEEKRKQKEEKEKEEKLKKEKEKQAKINKKKGIKGETDVEKGGQGDMPDETPKKIEDEEKKESIDEEPEEKKSELMIHQGIITIEYVLGTISHTASYLRLWALSLAHSQLSEVLWQMVMGGAVKISVRVGIPGFIAISFVWALFAGLTVAILVIMEGLSAFLHTLRLHWVEFNSKFYSGIGYEFTPFSFKKMIAFERGL